MRAWVEEFRSHGFTDSQARVLQSCLATRPDKRQKNAIQLAEQLGEVTVAPGSNDGSKLISLKSPSSTSHTLIVLSNYDPPSASIYRPTMWQTWLPRWLGKASQ